MDAVLRPRPFAAVSHGSTGPLSYPAPLPVALPPLCLLFPHTSSLVWVDDGSWAGLWIYLCSSATVSAGSSGSARSVVIFLCAMSHHPLTWLRPFGVFLFLSFPSVSCPPLTPFSHLRGVYFCTLRPSLYMVRVGLAPPPVLPPLGACPRMLLVLLSLDTRLNMPLSPADFLLAMSPSMSPSPAHILGVLSPSFLRLSDVGHGPSVIHFLLVFYPPPWKSVCPDRPTVSCFPQIPSLVLTIRRLIVRPPPYFVFSPHSRPRPNYYLTVCIPPPPQ